MQHGISFEAAEEPLVIWQWIRQKILSFSLPSILTLYQENESSTFSTFHYFTLPQ
jgi:hypothetical protein